jgi:hypothetical protein
MYSLIAVAVKSPVSRRFAGLALAACLALLFSASAVKAGCAVPYTGPVPAKAEPAPKIPFISHPADDDDDWREPGTIVGLWHLIYTATSTTAGPLPVPIVPPGSFPFLESYKTWHADGTEFENAFLPPVVGNVCFGVWKEKRDGSVKLHHIGLMFDPATGKVANVFTVDEINRVARDGKTYSGTFDFKIFDATDVYGTGTVLQEIKGTTAGTRISVPED